ncbi:carbamate kinase [Entomohabitans teleogrylli]|uniref:carbamate kinase n=1 Tax=Entomohabitans teleogrylli TaxID=1384589 RepID=UPI00073D5E3D|nr:carbamate kinase [Entomohabitans teleogrylli]
MDKQKIAVVAVGGNALIRSRNQVSLDEQYQAVKESARHVVNLALAGWRVVLTHGNGPQVGFILRRSEIAREDVPTVPLEYAVGDTQGAIGFMFQNALVNELQRRGRPDIPVVALVTQTVVNADDPAFEHPDKPIDAHMDEEVARRLAASQGWQIAEDAGRGWRRVVASPTPQAIIESPTVRRLLESNVLVIACGGGGIPVCRETDGSLRAVQAVIDKDRASALLASELNADLFIIPTGVEQVAVNFGTPQQRWLDALSADEAQALLDAGEFGAGSMAPKVEAILGWLATQPHGTGIITSPEAMGEAIHGHKGTRITH